MNNSDVIIDLLRQLREEVKNGKNRSALEITDILEEVILAKEDKKAEPEQKSERLAYTIPETAEMLGLHPTTVWKYILQGKIRAVKPGNKYLIPVNEIERLLKA